MTTLSREVQAIIAYVTRSGVPHRVTSTYRPGDDGRHGQAGTDGQSLAVDFAGPTQGDHDAMLAIWWVLLGVAPHLRELIFTHPQAEVLVRRGLRVVPAAYPPDVLAAHRNHVHVSVDRGVFVAWPWEAPMPDPLVDNPDVPNITGPIGFQFFTDPATGICTGYYMFSESTGEIHGWGPGAPYHGRSEDPTPELPPAG